MVDGREFIHLAVLSDKLPDRQIAEFLGKNIIDWGKIGQRAIYLGLYMMEAVGFTEFIYEEAVQQGMRVLISMKNKKNSKDLLYMRNKFLSYVFTPAWNFHKMYGSLNPFTYEGFECFYQEQWKKFNNMPIVPK